MFQQLVGKLEARCLLQEKIIEQLNSTLHERTAEWNRNHQARR